MSAKRPPNDADEYAGCRLFTSSTGLTGFALGTEVDALPTAKQGASMALAWQP